jgi:hypothetical protein
MQNSIAGLGQQEICISLHLAQLPGGLFNPSNQWIFHLVWLTK